MQRLIPQQPELNRLLNGIDVSRDRMSAKPDIGLRLNTHILKKSTLDQSVCVVPPRGDIRYNDKPTVTLVF